MSNTIRAYAPHAWLRCKIKGRASTKLKKGHTKKNCWRCW